MNKKLMFVILLILGVSFILTGQKGRGNRGQRGQNNNNPGQENQEWRRGSGNGYLYKLPYEDVSESEKAHLLGIREEEKLARDVYFHLAERLNMRIFERIAGSENRHMEAVKMLLDKYGIPDPVGENLPGQFSDSKFQDLYQTLITEGEVSIATALKVGAKIEDMDIFDLQMALKDSDNLDIKTLYQNLAKGSRNHLRSFISQLQTLQITYVPQFISLELFNSIINAPWERGPYNADGQPMIRNRCNRNSRNWQNN